MRTLVLASILLLAACQQPPSRSSLPPDLQQSPPELLSEWNLLEFDGRILEPREAVVYELNTPLFSDYAHKLRTIHVPPGTAIRYGDEAFEFPVGTIISKTFYYETSAEPRAGARTEVLKVTAQPEDTRLDLHRVRLLETRLLVNTREGWIALPYIWNDAQTDATLELAGDSLELELVNKEEREPFVYQVPDANQCAGCHAVNHREQRIAPIGVKARHLNRDVRYAMRTENQLTYWTRTGILSSAPPATHAPRNVRWDDISATLNARARAYLDVNCAHCHSEAAAANTSGLLLDANETDPTKLGVCKVPVATGRGSGTGSFDIVPGAPDESILLQRMESTEPDIAMPELGRALIHTEGVALIREWIAAMPGGCD